MYVYVFRYEFSPAVTDEQKFQLQLICVATANSMGITDFVSGFGIAASGSTGSYSGVVQTDDSGFDGFYVNPKFVQLTEWARPPLADFTSFQFQTGPEIHPEKLPKVD